METKFELYITNAIRWAQEHLGSTEFAGRCLAFVEDAYEKSNHVEIFGGSSAQESADEYGAAQNTGEPLIGAFVFYACAGPVGDEIKNWGHVGLCIGEGKVIHALDMVRIDDYLAVQELSLAPGWTKPQFIGWAPIERIFVGYRTKTE
jgi:cell wall-associated NlpC family hydrolase